MRKYTELLTIPIAFFIIILYNTWATSKGLHVMTWEKMEKFVVGLALFLLVIGTIRLTMIIVFPLLYKYMDPSFKENLKWHNLTPTDRTKQSLQLFFVLALVFALIINGL